MTLITQSVWIAIRRSAWLTAATLFLCSAACSAFAEMPSCRSKNQMKVVYPDFARRMKITGIVRLEVQVNANGSVRDTKILGGNPALVSAAQDAVKQSKFEGTDSCIATFEFKQ